VRFAVHFCVATAAGGSSVLECGAGLYQTVSVKTLYGIGRIISGGQAGADRAALDFALENGIETGGFVPLGRAAEDGRIPDKYQDLVETESADPAVRTEKNVFAGDATLIVSHGELSSGSLLTQQLAEKYKKPVLHLDLSEISVKAATGKLIEWFCLAKPSILNIAGPRASEDRDIYFSVRMLLQHVVDSERDE